MTTPEAAKLVCKALEWVAGRASLSAIRDIQMADETVIDFTDTFTGQHFRMLVEEVSCKPAKRT